MSVMNCSACASAAGVSMPQEKPSFLPRCVYYRHRLREHEIAVDDDRRREVGGRGASARAEGAHVGHVLVRRVRLGEHLEEVARPAAAAVGTPST